MSVRYQLGELAKTARTEYEFYVGAYYIYMDAAKEDFLSQANRSNASEDFKDLMYDMKLRVYSYNLRQLLDV